MKKEKTLAILMTCHNRMSNTDKCLNSIFKNILADISIKVFLVNDGCTDGTEKMVNEKYPQVKILTGDGNLFWNRGMYLAFSESAKIKYDYYLWLNDDVELFDDSLNKMLNTHDELSKKNPNLILVGVLTDSTKTHQTYGGIYIMKSFIPLTMDQREMGEEPLKCDTFHGNCVLIPQCVVNSVGLIDPFYQHAFGDADYGLRASRSGCDIWMTNYYIGICNRHDSANKWEDPNLSYRERKKAFHSKTANPYRDWKYFCKKFCGWNWRLRYYSPDIKLCIRSILKR